MIKLVAVFITFATSTIFFSTDRLTPLQKSAIQSGIRNVKLSVIAIPAHKTCNLSLKHVEAATLYCGEKLSEYKSDHTVLIDGSPRQNLKFYENDSMITSDHKTHCGYINLFGKQIGGVPRA